MNRYIITYNDGTYKIFSTSESFLSEQVMDVVLQSFKFSHIESVTEKFIDAVQSVANWEDYIKIHNELTVFEDYRIKGLYEVGFYHEL